MENPKIYSIKHERIDDIPLLVAMLIQLKIIPIINERVKVHGNHSGLSIGELVVIWLTFILSQGNHAKSRVEDWVAKRETILSRLLKTRVCAHDLNDDRLGTVLTYLSDVETWHKIEAALWQVTITVYQPVVEHVRLDASAASGKHKIHDSGMMQIGYSKDHRPDLPQVKIMAGSSMPSNMPLAHEVVSGEKADDSLYLNLIKRIHTMLGHNKMLYVGDSKMAAQEIRASLDKASDYYLVPLPMTGKMPIQAAMWIADCVDGEEDATLIWREGKLIGAGYERSRKMTGETETGESHTWNERIFVTRSNEYAQAQIQTLERQISAACRVLEKLTPVPARGKKAIYDLAALTAGITEIETRFKVEGLLQVAYARITAQKGKQDYYQIQTITRNESAIKRCYWQLGWRIMANNSPAANLSLTAAVLTYREGWGQEQQFHRIKDAPLGISPLWVRRDDQIRGLTHLLTLGLRILSNIEHEVRNNLKQSQEKLGGLYPGNPNRYTATPTAKMLLKAFVVAEPILIMPLGTSDKVETHITPLPKFLEQVLYFLRLPLSLYRSLEFSGEHLPLATYPSDGIFEANHQNTTGLSSA